MPKDLLAKSGIAPITSARSKASKLDDISAKASGDVLHHRHTRVSGWSPSHIRAMAESGRQHAGSSGPAMGLPTQAGAQGRDEKSRLWGVEASQLHF